MDPRLVQVQLHTQVYTNVPLCLNLYLLSLNTVCCALHPTPASIVSGCNRQSNTVHCHVYQQQAACSWSQDNTLVPLRASCQLVSGHSMYTATDRTAFPYYRWLGVWKHDENIRAEFDKIDVAKKVKDTLHQDVPVLVHSPLCSHAAKCILNGIPK